MHMELAWFTQEKRRNRGKSSTTSHGHAHQPHGFLTFKKELPISHQHIYMAYEIKQGAPNVRSSIRGGAFALDPRSKIAYSYMFTAHED